MSLTSYRAFAGVFELYALYRGKKGEKRLFFLSVLRSIALSNIGG